MKQLLEQLTLSSIFIYKIILDNEMKGRIILNEMDYPASGLPARELRILTKPDEFRRMEVNAEGGLVFWYEI